MKIVIAFLMAVLASVSGFSQEETNCSVKGNTLFCQTKHATAPAFTFFRHIMKKAVTSQLLPHLERKHTFLSVMNYQKEFY